MTGPANRQGGSPPTISSRGRPTMVSAGRPPGNNPLRKVVTVRMAVVNMGVSSNLGRERPTTSASEDHI
jgi:hypothetical protein